MEKKEKTKRDPITYHLTLDKAAITYKNGIYTGKAPKTFWSPINPDSSSDGWQDGDKLSIVCTFNLNPDVTPQPGANDYEGLSVGACKAGSDDDPKLIELAKSLVLPNVGQILTLDANKPTIVTEADNPPDTAIFYNAIKSTYTYTLNNGDKLKNYIYKWVMTYNGKNIVTTGTNVEIVFAYGDPRSDPVPPPVRLWPFIGQQG